MPVAARSYRWSESQSVHVAELDEQHKKLFGTINELDAVLRAGGTNLTIDPILDRLVDYAITHFASEESLLEKHSFPGLAEHRRAHADFREKIAGFVIDHKAGQQGIAGELLVYMRSWLAKHVIEMDQQYASFLKARGVH